MHMKSLRGVVGQAVEHVAHGLPSEVVRVMARQGFSDKDVNTVLDVLKGALIGAMPGALYAPSLRSTLLAGGCDCYAALVVGEGLARTGAAGAPYALFGSPEEAQAYLDGRGAAGGVVHVGLFDLFEVAASEGATACSGDPAAGSAQHPPPGPPSGGSRPRLVGSQSSLAVRALGHGLVMALSIYIGVHQDSVAWRAVFAVLALVGAVGMLGNLVDLVPRKPRMGVR
jgi:hypothetical protein